MAVIKIIFICLTLSMLQAKPVVRKLNFNIFLLSPKNTSQQRIASKNSPEYVKNAEKVLLSTNGVSRFPPILEYIVQRIQGMFSVYVHEDQSSGSPLLTNSDLQLLASSAANVSDVNQPPDTSENEVRGEEDDDRVGEIHGIDSTTGLSNVIVKPSSLHPGTYEVEISVAVDDGQPSD